MGLDTSHGAWRGAYSAFNRWRDQLARTAGYELVRLDGDYRDTILIDWGHIVPKNYYGDWDDTPSDPLIILIAHSDTEGVIHPEHAGLLAERLEQILPQLPDGEGGGHIGDWREKTQAFIDGLRRAADAVEDLDFH